jgi:hypothetical protein
MDAVNYPGLFLEAAPFSEAQKNIQPKQVGVYQSVAVSVELYTGFL